MLEDGADSPLEDNSDQSDLEENSNDGGGGSDGDDADSGSDGENEEEDDDDNDDDGGEEEDEETGDVNANANAGWAEAMAKILGKKTSESKSSLLTNNKELKKIKEKDRQQQLEKKTQVKYLSCFYIADDNHVKSCRKQESLPELLKRLNVQQLLVCRCSLLSLGAEAMII